MSSQSSHARQDFIARIRYSNALPPPPNPPKLLDIPNTGLASGQYTTPGFASRLAREQPLNIEADAELGMPLDLVGMPGVFDGDESCMSESITASPRWRARTLTISSNPGTVPAPASPPARPSAAATAGHPRQAQGCGCCCLLPPPYRVHLQCKHHHKVEPIPPSPKEHRPAATQAEIAGA